jgi:hypothetical protein
LCLFILDFLIAFVGLVYNSLIERRRRRRRRRRSVTIGLVLLLFLCIDSIVAFGGHGARY